MCYTLKFDCLELSHLLWLSIFLECDRVEAIILLTVHAAAISPFTKSSVF